MSLRLCFEPRLIRFPLLAPSIYLCYRDRVWRGWVVSSNMSRRELGIYLAFFFLCFASISSCIRARSAHPPSLDPVIPPTSPPSLLVDLLTPRSLAGNFLAAARRHTPPSPNITVRKTGQRQQQTTTTATATATTTR